MATRDQVTPKRQAILDAATIVFSENGYVGANLDQVVSAAAISKQTLYKHFADKASLFREMVLELSNQVYDRFLDLPEPGDIEDVDAWIQEFALQFTRAVMDPTVQRIRRLIMAEAPRFPDVAEAYWERGFTRVLGAVADHFAALDAAGRLEAPDPLLAAHHFAGLLLWIPSNRTMFSGRPDVVTDEEIQHYAREGAAAFLRAYAA